MKRTALPVLLVVVALLTYALTVALLSHTPSTTTAQDALWYPINALGPTWWLICSAFALPGAVLLFLTMIMNEKLSALLFGRMLILGSLVCFALTPLNSGWLPYGAMFASVGGLFVTILVATRWCERTDKWEVVARMVGRRRNEGADAEHTAQRARFRENQ